MQGFKQGIAPKGKETYAEFWICEICGSNHFFYGSAKMGKGCKCIGCRMKKEKKKVIVKRNPRIIKRN